MDKLLEYIETNVKLAYKAVTFHFKQYVWFYITLFIVQCMFGTVLITHNTANNITKEQLNNSYDSHYMFYYLNTDQMMYLKKSSQYVFADEYIFDITHSEIMGKETDKNCKYNIGITFAGDPQEYYGRFAFKFMNNLRDLGDLKCEPTPLFSLDKYISDSNAQMVLFLTFLSIISILLLSVLYGIKVNNYRFDYGIYMTFGADKRKLLKTSFWEMTVIALLTFIPALVFSAVVSYLITRRVFGLFGITFSGVLILLAFSLLINATAISFSVIKTSLKKPVDLIISADNSNYVHSPRVSIDLLKNRSLLKTLRVSMLRYYKYYLATIIAGVFFTSTFVALFFCRDMYLQKRTDAISQFRLELYNGYTYTEQDRLELLSIDGITGTVKEHSTLAGELNEHILIKKQNTKGNSDLAHYNKLYDAMDNVSYVAADSEVIQQLKNADYIGDLNSVLSSENTVIITDSFTNKTMLEFKPGDKIKIADYLGKTDELTTMLVGNDLLKEKLKCNIYGYKEYTVGAVLRNATSNNNIKIYLPVDEYEIITGKTVEYTSIDLYVDTNLTDKKINILYDKLISHVNAKYNKGKDVNAFIINTYGNANNSIAEKTHSDVLLAFIGVMLLIFSQLMWVFSQNLFFKKRSNEFSVMRTIGFKMSEIRKIHLYEGFTLSGLGTIIYIVLSYLFCFAVKWFMNSILFGYSYRYLTEVPFNILIVGAIVTFGCGIVSTYIPFIFYKRKNNNAIPE